ncbi:3-oxo-5-alpha-steroid 4-dehydrogenase 1-like isoform X2 [Saccostrea cucullata]|uniref:3-oxo-5-alpha-steroid 4-dehydrogenase 1-like isoform X2 n=1 Tax=Saccostrea cuccullata TaxID=36930 RepID=UPI002ED36FDC
MGVQNWIDKVLGLDLEVFNFLSYNLLFFGIVVVIVLQFLNTPYGRYARGGWGVDVNAKLAWFVQEIPAFLVPVLLIYCVEGPKITHIPNKILLGLFLLHYFQRSIIYPLLIRGGKPTPLIPFLLAFAFCACNGYLQAGYIIKYADFGSEWMWNWRFYLGGMFEYVSGANFLGEILEWFGFALANGSLSAFSFFFFTLCNIGPRACHHHQWYKQKFEDYPQERKALIPFII